jgi:hypothetical protein
MRGIVIGAGLLGALLHASRNALAKAGGFHLANSELRTTIKLDGKKEFH